MAILLDHIEDPDAMSLPEILDALCNPEMWDHGGPEFCEPAAIYYLAAARQLGDVCHIPDEDDDRHMRTTISVARAAPVRKVIDALLRHGGQLPLLWTERAEAPLVAFWRMWSRVFPTDDKLALYSDRAAFFRTINFVMSIFVDYAREALTAEPTEESMRELVFCARAFHFFANYVFQLPPSLRKRRIICVHADVVADPLITKALHIDASNCKDYATSCKRFYTMYGVHRVYADHERWLSKNKAIPRIMFMLEDEAHMPFLSQMLISEWDPVLAAHIHFMQVRGWTESLASEECTTRNHALLIIHDCCVWMEKRADVPFWRKHALLLRHDRPDPYSFSPWPRILDMSNNEWAMMYKRRAHVGSVMQVLELYCRVLRTEFRCEIPRGPAEVDMRGVHTFLRPAIMPPSVPDPSIPRDVPETPEQVHLTAEMMFARIHPPE